MNAAEIVQPDAAATRLAEDAVPASLERQLAAAVSGEVRFDRLSRWLYSTDASMYQILPRGVVIPRSRQDVVRTVEICRRHGVPVTARGGGTALAGQSVGHGVQLDFAKYMNKVLEINAEEKWARVEPGVVLDNINAELKRYGLQFAPDVATSSRASLGGMIANNSSGAHSVIYGKTGDHVLELECLLADGNVVRFAPTAGADLAAKRRLDTLEGSLYREIPALAQRHADEIDKRFPKIMRRVGGYNLEAFVDPAAPVDLSRMVLGSEGSLALVLEAKIKLTDLPKAKGLCLVEFDEMLDSLSAVVPILAHHPAAVELVDKLILDRTKGRLDLEPVRAVLTGDPGAVLIVEFYDDSAEAVAARIEACANDLRQRSLGYAWTPAVQPDEQARIWELRKSGLGLVMLMHGDSKPFAFVEDTAVSPEHLRDYIAEFAEIVNAHDTYAGYYAHASVGCLHVRPVLDMKCVAGREQLKSIAEQVSSLVLKYGGSMSAEHGDGLVRGCWNRKMFGDTLYEAFRQVKRIFDPENLFNPGKIVDTPDVTENLRILWREQVPEVVTRFDFSTEGGFYRAVEMCSGLGYCRKTLSGTMCPSYMATREEQHSTRGRANALRAALEGKLPGRLGDADLYAVLDLCLACKGCKQECPSGVDMAKLKYEFLAHYHRIHGVPLASRLVAHIDHLSRLGSTCAPLANLVAAHPMSRWLGEKLLGFDRRRAAPRLTGRRFVDWFRRHPAPDGPSQRGEVVLFHDTWMNYYEPSTGMSAVQLIEAAGYRALLADVRCCGRPAISKGLLDRAVELATHNVTVLFEHVRAGRLIVGVEPSCLLTLRDEYPSLLRGELREKAQAVAAATRLVEEFVAELPEDVLTALRFRAHAGKVLVHGHCHQKALVGMGPLETALRLVPDLRVEVIDSGCCGMAGSFGYEAGHYDVSEACATRRLIPTIAAADEAVPVLAPGTSCRAQIAHFAHRTAVHPVEFLAQQLEQD